MHADAEDWIHDARQAIQFAPVDYFAVDRIKYWKDLILCAVMAYTFAGVYLASSVLWQQVLAFPLAVFWLYRSNSMVHEVSHLNRYQLTSFKIAWNLILGVPTLFPSTFFTSHHRDHHSGRHYGTPQDPEYIVNVFKPGSVTSAMLYLVHILLYPLFALFRFMFAPISFLTPRWREFTLRRLSSFTLNWKYERNVSQLGRKPFVIIELLCCVRAWMIPMGVLLGLTTWTRIPQMYFLAITILFFNQMRFFADHHFESDGKRMSMSDHITDSCNYTNQDFLTWLFFPFTIRLHALHHLFPTIPYHNLPAAHEYLSNYLAARSEYHSLNRPSWWHTAKRTLRFAPKNQVL